MTNYLDQMARDIRQAVPSSDLPDEDTHQLFRSYAVLALAKGVEVTLRDVHNAWVAWMTDKDPDHESLIPFEQLDAETAAADGPYVDAIREVVRSRASA